VRRVLVVTDSSACIPLELVNSLGICVLPISVFLPEGEVELSEQLDEETLVLPEGAEDAELAAANRPFVTEYLAAVEETDAEAAVVGTPAIEFATMYRNAALAAELAEHPVVTIDARSAAAGQALVVLAGAELAAAGAPLEEVVRAIEDAVDRVELVASLATLEPIRRSVPLPSSVLGETGPSLSRSLFRMRAGSVEPLGEPGGAEDALTAIAAARDESSPEGTERIVVFHAGASDLAEELAVLLGGVDFVCGFSVAMQVHTGRGVVGAAWLPKMSGAAR
jgi:DegV family protein with EDD domain